MNSMGPTNFFRTTDTTDTTDTTIWKPGLNSLVISPSFSLLVFFFRFACLFYDYVYIKITRNRYYKENCKTGYFFN